MATHGLTLKARHACRACGVGLLALMTLTALSYAAGEVHFQRAAALLAGRPSHDVEAQPSEHPPVLGAVPEFSFVDQQGGALTKTALRDHVWIANFIFTRCTSVCPTLTAKMRVLQRKLPNPQLRFVSFSVDPEHDTPSALFDYAKGWGQGETRWSLLHTEPASLQRLSDGLRVVTLPGGSAGNPIVHTSLFFLVDGAGRVRGLYDSDDESAVQHLIDDTRALSANESGAEDSSVRNGSGEKLFDALGCRGCHDDPKLAPTLHGIWNEPVALAGGARARVDAGYLLQSLVAPSTQLVEGYLDLMPSYANELSDSQLQAVVDYVKSLSSTVALAHLPVDSSTPSAAPPSILTQDPVCGMKVRATSETPRAMRDGREYSFCSEHCREQFLAKPTAPRATNH